LDKATRSRARPVRSTDKHQNIAAVAQNLNNHQHQFTISKLEHFTHFFEKNFE